MRAQDNRAGRTQTLCTLSLYDQTTGEALASYRVEIDETVRQMGSSPYRSAILRPENRFAPVSDFRAIVVPTEAETDIDGLNAPVELRIEVVWPDYHTRSVSLHVSRGDTAKVELRPLSEAAEPTGSDGFDDRVHSRFRDRYRSEPSPETPRGPSPAATTTLWSAFEIVLKAQSYASAGDITRVRRAAALLFHADGMAPDAAAAFRDAHAQANAYLDAREREVSR